MNRHKSLKKLTALGLSAAMILGMIPVSAFAQHPDNPIDSDSEIIAFEALEDSVANQVVSIGTSREDLNLPDVLMGMTELEEPEEPEEPAIATGSNAGRVPDLEELIPEEDESATPVNARRSAGKSTGATSGSGIATDSNGSSQAAVPVAVAEWVSEPAYDPETTGVYIFTPKFDEERSFEEGVEGPKINVQVVSGMMLLNTGNIYSVEPYSVTIEPGGTNVLKITHSWPQTSALVPADEMITIVGDIQSPGTANHSVIVKNGAQVNLTIRDLHIDLSSLDNACAFQVTGNSTVNLTLQGTNILSSGVNQAGIEVSKNNTLIISAADTNDTLTARGGVHSSGIGGSAFNVNGGDITIDGGTVIAIGNDQGAGMGAGTYNGTGSAGNIEINGGIVIANADTGAGIGNGRNGNGGSITINGGMVTATSRWGAGIGSGYQGEGGSVRITGGTIVSTAQYGNAQDIGDGGNNVKAAVTITGGSVNISRNTISPQPTNGSKPVYLNVLTVGNPHIGDDEAVLAVGYDSTENYGNHDVVTKNGGKVYAWLPQNSNADARVEVIGPGGIYYRGVKARTGALETQTLLLDGNAAVPSLSVQPQDDTYIQGDPAIPLSVAADVTDGGILSYQWYQNISNSISGSTAVGTNSASYTPDTGTVGTLYYYCVVTNTNASVSGTQTAAVTSDAAAVTVNALVHAETPGITDQPQDAAYDQGSTATPLVVTAGVTDGGMLSYQWYQNTSNSTINGSPVGTNSESFTPDTSIVGTLYYYCVITNTNSSVSGMQTAAITSSTAAVTVNALVHAETPGITDQPQDAAYDQGSTATPLIVTAGVTDGGMLSYQWYQNTSNSTINGSPVGTNSESYIPDTSIIDTLYYYCVITNTNSSASGNQTAIVTSSIAAVTVNTLTNAVVPTITVQPASHTVGLGTAVTLSVSAAVSDSGTLSYQWYRSTADSNTSGSPISGAVSSAYAPPTSTAGTIYYYAEVTNTNNSVNGQNTAAIVSNTATVTVRSSRSTDDSDSSSSSSHNDLADWTVNSKTVNMPTSATRSLTEKPDQDGQLTITITRKMAEDGIAAAKAKWAGRKSLGISLVVQNNAEGTKSQTAVIESAALDHLVSQGVKSLTIQCGIYQMTLDEKAIKSLDMQSNGAVTATITPIKVTGAAAVVIDTRPVFEIVFRDSTGKEIADFGSGTITRGIKYTAASWEKDVNLFIVKVVNQDPQWVDKSIYDSGWVIWSGSTCSVYGVGCKTSDAYN